MHYLIAYDISADRLRGRLARALERQGCYRLQRSVFFARDFQPAELQTLRLQLEQLLHAHGAPTDSLLCFPIERDLAADVFWRPAGVPPDALTKKVYKMLF